MTTTVTILLSICFVSQLVLTMIIIRQLSRLRAGQLSHDAFVVGSLNMLHENMFNEYLTLRKRTTANHRRIDQLRRALPTKLKQVYYTGTKENLNNLIESCEQAIHEKPLHQLLDR